MEELIILVRRRIEHETQVSSSQHGIRTDYIKNVFEATLDTEVSVQGLLDTPCMKTISVRPSTQTTDTSATPSLFPRRMSWGTANGMRNFTTFTFEKQRHKQVYAWMQQDQFDYLTEDGSFGKLFLDRIMQDFRISEAVML